MDQVALMLLLGLRRAITRPSVRAVVAKIQVSRCDPRMLRGPLKHLWAYFLFHARVCLGVEIHAFLFDVHRHGSIAGELHR
jgi:hypothetical protein